RPWNDLTRGPRPGPRDGRPGGGRRRGHPDRRRPRPRTPGGGRTVSWWLDELGHAGAEHLDPTYIAGYDRKSGFDPGADLELRRGLGLDSPSSLIDMGAGTGALAAAAAPLCRRVVAVDLSTAMLDALRARAETRGIQNLEVVRAGFLSYVHTGDPADFVY